MQIAPDGSWFTIIGTDNGHVHFRQDELMRFLVPIFIKSGWRHRLVAEPNTVPAILTGSQAVNYGKAIRTVAETIEGGETLYPVLTIQITEETTGDMIRDAFMLGVRVCKVYPRYVTTHSNNGVVDYTKIYKALAVAEELGMIVQFHAEHPSYNIIGRLKESSFRGILNKIRRFYPNLKISIEHVSSRDMVYWVKDQPFNVGAGIAIQYIYVTEDDLKGYSKRSGGLICIHDAGFKPCAKDPQDQRAIQEAALSGSPKFWCGNDDAPHLKKKKITGMCGSWNTIASLSLTFSFFERNSQLGKAEYFLSKAWADFYGFPHNTTIMKFIREEWTVPLEVPVPGLDDSIVPFFAGEKMEWKLAA